MFYRIKCILFILKKLLNKNLFVYVKKRYLKRERIENLMLSYCFMNIFLSYIIFWRDFKTDSGHSCYFLPF